MRGSRLVVWVAVVSVGFALGGARAYTLSSARLAAVELNGKPMSEAGLNAALAGYFGVPVVMISGDDITAEDPQRS